MGLAIVLALRLTLPVLVLRWNFFGALIAIFADAIDILIFQLTSFPRLGYHATDKLLDVYSMALFLAVSLRWRPGVRAASLALFAYRMIGVAAFELTDRRILLLAFPNVFEFFYLFNAARCRFAPTYRMTPLRWGAWMAGITAAKLFQEYALHGARWLDRWSAAEILKSVIRWLVRA